MKGDADVVSEGMLGVVEHDATLTDKQKTKSTAQGLRNLNKVNYSHLNLASLWNIKMLIENLQNHLIPANLYQS